MKRWEIKTRLHRSLLVLVLCALVLALPAQDKKGKLYSRQTSMISVYLDSAQFLSAKAPFRAMDNINKAIELSIGDNDKNNEGLSYWILGNIQQNLDQHELAADNYKKCIATLQPRIAKFSKGSSGGDAASNLTLFNAYKHLAVSLSFLGRTDEAYNNVLKCFSGLFYSVSEKDKLDASRIKADILVKQGKTEEAITVLNTTLEGEKKLFNLEGEARTYISLGSVYLEAKNESKAIESYTQAKFIAEKTKIPGLLVTINNRMAKIFRQQKNADKELEVRNSNIANTIKTQEVVQQNQEIGNAYLNAKQIEKAVPFFEKSLYTDKMGNIIIPKALFEKSSDLEGTANTYKLLAEAYLEMGNTEKALAYLKVYAEIQDSIKSIRKRELNEALKLSNQIGKNQQRIGLLEKERNLSEKSIQILKQDRQLKEEELYTRNIIIGTLCFLMVFMFVGAFYILRSSREKRRVNQLLAIKSLRGQMNPHFIFNALNSVNHYISQNDERSANKYLSDFSKLMRSVMETSKHDLILLSEELEILKLYLQLEHARFKEKFDYTLTIDPGLDPADFELPPMIIQPFIENAVWHGLRYLDGKGLLEIEIGKNEKALLVTITDNGIGRKKSLEIKTKNQKLQNSTGMQNIDNRIKIMNELFDTHISAEVLDAFPGQENKGTRVNLTIPKKINQHA